MTAAAPGAPTTDMPSVKSTLTAKLQKDSSIDRVVTLGAPIALTAVQSVKDAGSKAKVATFDLSKDLVGAVRGGGIEFAVDQQPYLQGYLAVAALWLYKTNGNVSGDGTAPVLTGPAFVTKDNVDGVAEFAEKGTRWPSRTAGSPMSHRPRPLRDRPTRPPHHQLGIQHRHPRLQLPLLQSLDGEPDGVLGHQEGVLADGGQTDRHQVREVHPHADGHIQTQPEIERLLNESDSRYTNLCLDTGHVAYGGGDNLDLIRRFGERVGYVHLKQMDPGILAQVAAEDLSFGEAVKRGVCVSPPAGVPEPAGMVAELARLDAELFVIVEQDLYPCAPEVPLPIAVGTREHLSGCGLSGTRRPNFDR